MLSFESCLKWMFIEYRSDDNYKISEIVLSVELVLKRLKCLKI
jgi:hypothetical protein